MAADEEEPIDLEDIVTEIDSGLAPGNYFNYPDHDVALQAEVDLLDGIEGYFNDEAFPADSRQLYFDPTHPPKGSLPGTSIIFNRISAGEVMDCIKPVFVTGKASTPMITQGAIGNSNFIKSPTCREELPATVNDTITFSNSCICACLCNNQFSTRLDFAP